MITVEKIPADYFDDCDECGEIVDHDAVYIIDLEYSHLKLCYKCTKLLNKKLSRTLEAEVSDGIL